MATEDTSQGGAAKAADVNIQTDPLGQMACEHCQCGIDVSEVPSFSTILCPECGEELTVSARFGNFRMLKLLGTGGMGGVFLARDETLGRQVAIKVMLKSLGDDAQFVETFRREAQAAARLNHPNIAQIYSFGQEKGQPYIAMELVSGRHFDEMIDDSEGAGLDPVLVMQVGADIADGLGLAAEANLIHGDIKPENILLDERNNAKLVDFGIAGASGQQDTEVWGTPYYIAPEKVRRRKADERSDIYSLGATLYHALAGHPPFEGETAIDVIKARFNAAAPALNEVRADIPEELANIIARMLEEDPARRYPTYKSLIGDMQRYLKSAGAPGRTGPLSGKRVVIRKKGSTGPNADAGGGLATKRHSASAPKKRGFVVQKGSLPAPRREGADPVTQEPGGAPPTPAGAKSGGKGCLIAFLIVSGVCLLLTAAGVGVGVHFYRKFMRAAETVKATVSSEEARVAAIKSAATADIAKLEQWADDALELAYTATGLIYTATGKWVLPDLGLVGEPPLAPVMPAPELLLPADHVMTAPVTQLFAHVKGVLKTAAEARVLVDAILVEPITIPAPVGRGDLAGLLRLIRQPGDALAARLEPLAEALVQGQQELAAARGNVAELEGEVGKREAERKAAEALRLEAERKAREDAEAAQREAEQQAIVDGEIAMVDAEIIVRLEDLRTHAYERVLRNLTLLGLKLKTDEGNAALALAKERVERLKTLKASLVKYLAGGLRWGWLENGRAIDIDSADAKSITVGGEPKKWSEAGTAQMVKLIRHYTDPMLREPRIGANERAELLVNGALYIYLMGQGNDRAMEMARSMVLSAAELRPSFRAKAQRLMPDLVLDE